jgi:PAP2 superfamily
MGRRRGIGIAALAVVVALLAAVPGQRVAGAATAAASSGPTVVVRWDQAALQGIRDSTLGPPMAARALAILHTCVYDAWAAYDPVAVGTRLGGSLRRPAAERTAANKEQAISFAAYRAAVDLFPADRTRFDALMAGLGYDPADTTTDTSVPAGVGNVACQAVLDFRHHDGANQLGDLHPGPYSDYTGYVPVNDPMVVASFDPATVHDPDRWQPLRFTDAAGREVTQGFVGAQWQHVVPFALRSASQFRSRVGPARAGSNAYLRQARELLEISANLTDRRKAIAEYWANGPRSELPPGHWALFGEFVSARDRDTVDQDAKMFFALANAVFDAGIAAWDGKRAFDSVRPITAVRWLFHGRPVHAWAGPGLGTRVIDGGDWLPYQPATFPTPPFPEYPSGHSTFSAAGATILALFTGSDAFGGSVTIPAGSSTVEPGISPRMDVTLSWPTFTAAANEAGISRRYGGIHFRQGDLDGRLLGRLVGVQAWAKALTYFAGLARP